MNKIISNLLLLFLITGGSWAHAQQVVLAGSDLWATPGGSQTEYSFANTPIPADFFGLGSESFEGTVVFGGLPFNDNPGLVPQGGIDLGLTDTIIKRPDDFSIEEGGDPATVPIELVALSLVSVEPIEVTFNGQPDPVLFDIEIQAAPDILQSGGVMRVMPGTQVTDFLSGGIDIELTATVDMFFVNADTNQFVGTERRILPLTIDNQPFLIAPFAKTGFELVEVNEPLRLGSPDGIIVPPTTPDWNPGFKFHEPVGLQKCVLTTLQSPSAMLGLVPAFQTPGLDFDGDGINDVCDNCPVAWNPFQSDANGNCVGDICDNDAPIQLAIENGDSSAVPGVLSQAADQPNKRFLVNFDFPGSDPEPWILNETWIIAGDVELRASRNGGLCPRGTCKFEHDPGFTGNTMEVENGASLSVWNAGFDPNPGGAIIVIDNGASVDTWDSSLATDGSNPAIVNRGGDSIFAHSALHVGCVNGGVWAYDQVDGHTELMNSVILPVPGCEGSDVAGADIPGGGFHTSDSLLGSPANCTGNCGTHSTVFGLGVGQPPSLDSNLNRRLYSSDGNKPESQCNDFGSGAFNSLGYNVDIDGSCSLDQPTDLPNTDPLVEVDENGIPQPLAGSPLIESGPVDFVNNQLPCMFKDMNDLGRPQDFDLDGIFTCDRGPVEVQGGPDIGAPQSAAFYDTGRDGEGVFVEILENGRAVVSFYTYSPDGLTMAWFVGSGNLVGNSVVVDELQRVTGGVFGTDFDPAKIIRKRVGGMSLVFPDCEALENPGMLNFTAESGSGLENLLQKAFRLTSVVDCDGAPVAANAHRSGAFFAPDRSGEGIFVEWLSDGRVVIVFYTFDPAGNPFWLTSVVDETAINGNTVTANMLYAEGKTKFGAAFNPAEVMLSPWGTVTLTYNDDNNLTFAHDSIVAGFDAGSHAYIRLTKLLGTD